MPPRRLAARVNKFKGCWRLIRRIPAEFDHINDRSLIQITGIGVTSDPRSARDIALPSPHRPGRQPLSRPAVTTRAITAWRRVTF